MLLFSFVLLLSASLILSAPSPALKYDQRQEGEWNVRADLENFVILVIPTSSSAAASGTGGGTSLLDLLSKAVPFRSHIKRKHVKKTHHQQVDQGTDVDTEQFIESKTAPYHVDITRSRNNLAKLHPKPENSGGLLVAKSPSIALVKGQENRARFGTENSLRLSKAFIITAPEEVEIIKSHVKKDSKKQVHPKKEIKKKAEVKTDEVNGEDLKLLGSGEEQCGPGLRRDSQGICRIISSRT